MSLPPSFPQSFYAVLSRAAKAAGMTRAQFATKAVKYYEAALKKKISPVTTALGKDVDSYTEQARRISQTWWSGLTAEEKSARAKVASDARWGKKKPKKSK